MVAKRFNSSDLKSVGPGLNPGLKKLFLRALFVFTHMYKGVSVTFCLGEGGIPQYEHSTLGSLTSCFKSRVRRQLCGPHTCNTVVYIHAFSTLKSVCFIKVSVSSTYEVAILMPLSWGFPKTCFILASFFKLF